MTLRLDAGMAARVAELHDSATASIDAAASSAPSTVDGGVANGYLFAILSAVADTSALIGVLSTGVAGQVRDVADDIGFTESEIADHFRLMRGLIEPQSEARR